LFALLIGSLNLASDTADRPEIRGDSAKYHALALTVEMFLQHPDLAQRLFQGDLTPEERDDIFIDRWEFQHAPAYVLTLGLFYSLLPNDQGAGRALSVIFYAASAMLLLLIGRVFLGRWLAWFAYFGFLLYLPLLYYASAIATEMFSVLILLLCSWVLIRFHQRPTIGRILVVGLCLALLFLAKTTFRPLAIAIVVGEMIFCLCRRRYRQSFWVTVGALSPIFLWYLFLLIVAIPLEPLSKSGDSQLWLYRGNYVPDQGWETVGIGDAVTPELRAGGSAAISRFGKDAPEELLRREMYKNALVETIKQYPGEWVALVLKKFGLFWKYPARKWYIDSVLGSWPVPLWTQHLIFLLALLGLSISFRRGAPYWLPALLLLSVSAVHSVSHLVARYNIPVLPLWWIYACFGLKSIWVTLSSLLRHGQLSWLKDISLWYPVAGLCLAGFGVWLRTIPFGPTAGQGYALYLAGSILTGLALFSIGPILVYLAGKLQPLRKRRRWYLMIGPAVLSAVVIGDSISERDWDQMALELKRPGDGVVQRISYSDNFAKQHGGLQSAQIFLDLLRSPKGSFTLDLFVDGKLHHTFQDTLEGSYQAFEFDQERFGEQGRYKRVASTLKSYVERYLNPRYGDRSIGYDFFRRWVRVDLPLEQLSNGPLEIELRLRESANGGWVRVYGDRYIVRDHEQEQYFTGPSLDDNLFEHSSYRAEFYGGNRDRMDARLIRRKKLESPWVRSMRRTEAGITEDLSPWPGQQGGQWRIRVKTLLQGQMILRPMEDGTVKRLWTKTILETDQRMDQKQLRSFQGWRDSYFDGSWVY